MKIQNKSSRLLKNKIIIAIVLLILIGLLIFVGVKTYKSPIQRKLIGDWNIEFENSYIERDSVCKFTGMIINIGKDSIFLPQIYEPFEVDFQGKTFLDEDFVFFDNKVNVEKYKKYSDRMLQKRKGTWEVISTNPDSVFFNVPNNPLHGKYAIRFFIDENGYDGMNNIYKIELKNDSTYLICNKGG